MPGVIEDTARDVARNVAKRATKKAVKKVAKAAGKKLVIALAVKGGFWLAIAMAILMLLVLAAGGSKDEDGATLHTGTGIVSVGGQVQVPADADVTVRNAAAIANVAYARYGSDARGQLAATLGIDVAIAEASLMNYANDGTSEDYGHFPERRQLNASERAVAAESLKYPHDAVGHNLDSIGLFQQRPSAGWGTPAELIDPTKAAGKFYDALDRIDGWDAMETYTAAQKVQGSNDPTGGIYARVWDQAVAMVKQLSAYRTTPGGGGGVTAQGVNVPIPAGASITGTIVAPNATVAKAIAAGLSRLGTPYSWGGGDAQGPTTGICATGNAWNDCHIVGFDCSGLMSYMWAQVGIQVGSYTQTQWDASKHIPWDQRVVGDMVGYGGGGTNHISMYIGEFNGVPMQLEAPYSGEYVRISKIKDSHHSVAYRLWEGTS